MKVYIYYDKEKPEINLIYNVLTVNVELEKIEIEAESVEEALSIFKNQIKQEKG